MTTSRTIGAEIAWPINVVGGANVIRYQLVVSGVTTSYTITLTPGTYWAPKLRGGLPNDLYDEIETQIIAATGQATQIGRGFNGPQGAPAIFIQHSNPNVTAQSLLLGDALFTLPKNLLGWLGTTTTNIFGLWSPTPPAGSFLVADGAYSAAYKNSRLPEWRPKREAYMTLSDSSPNAFRGFWDVRSTVDFEASGVAGPWVRGELFSHAPSMAFHFGGNLLGSSDVSLSDLYLKNPDNLRYIVKLDNPTNQRTWWAPARLDESMLDDLSKWVADEPGYPGEHCRVRIKLRLLADMVRP
jgi:hypothetical protein